MRRSADSGSPWEPVEMTTTRWSGQSSTSWGWIEHPLGDLDVAQRAADVDVLAHRASHQRDLAPERGGGVDHLLHAVDVGGEAGDDDPALGAAEDLLQVRARRRARRGRTPAGRRWWSRRRAAGRPREPSSASRETSAGGAVDRGLVELVVAGEQHGAELGADRDRARVGDRVRHVDELDRERARARAARPGRRPRGRPRAGCARRAWSGPWRSSGARRARECRRRWPSSRSTHGSAPR